MINTHKGLFCYTIVSSAPGIFQCIIQNVLQGKVVVYLDDILIPGEMDEEHLQIWMRG